jgi:hypothetical protein
MDNNEYLRSVLSGQSLGEDSAELKELQTQRANVEKLVRESFGSVPIIRYGGSKAKGTLVKEYYDLDIVCYLPCDSVTAGENLQEIYENVRDCLKKGYIVEEKTSALRLKGNAADNYMRDFHIDVVPGRFSDENNSDCFIYQKAAEKCRLKTNLDVHIQHIKDSGVVDAIRLLKVWKARRGLRIKQFVFELLIIDLLDGMETKSLSDQLTHVWEEMSASVDPTHVEDPANPSGNDLSEIMKAAWPMLRAEATNTLNTIKWSGWEAVFGAVPAAKSASIADRAQRASAFVSTPNKPWCPKD